MNKAKRFTLPKAKRNREEIMRWMLAQHPTVTVTGIGKELDVHYTTVSNTLADRCNNRQVLRYLWDKGCPVRFLALPAKMKATFKQAA